jgi:hypothetical protein
MRQVAQLAFGGVSGRNFSGRRRWVAPRPRSPRPHGVALMLYDMTNRIYHIE